MKDMTERIRKEEKNEKINKETNASVFNARNLGCCLYHGFPFPSTIDHSHRGEMTGMENTPIRVAFYSAYLRLPGCKFSILQIMRCASILRRNCLSPAPISWASFSTSSGSLTSRWSTKPMRSRRDSGCKRTIHERS